MSTTQSERKYTPKEQLIMDAGIEIGRKEVLQTLWDMEKECGGSCFESEGTNGCDEANMLQHVRIELEKRLETENRNQND